ncbi:hypothetical protein QW180_21680 [Vibrio sinaloensis]|nr:hypothetical protein [Vibrio sinaloensis]
MEFVMTSPSLAAFLLKVKTEHPMRRRVPISGASCAPKMKLINPHDIDTLQPGVLTVTNATGHPTYTPHSYYVGEGHILYSTNDPFFLTKWKKSKVNVSTEHGVGAVTYSLATLKAALNNVSHGPNGASARIGTDNRDLQFYWCSTAIARLGWWAQ